MEYCKGVWIVDDEVQSQIVGVIASEHIQNVAIVGHDNPDADAIGSMVALEIILKQLNKNVTLITQTKVKSKYNKILGKRRIDKIFIPNEFFDAIFIVDCSSKARIRFNISEYTDKIIVIDHHDGFKPYGDIYFFKKTISNTMLIYSLILKLKQSGYDIKLTKDLATSLYLGIVSDSFNFRAKDISSDVYRAVADLIDANADVDLVNYIESFPQTMIPLECEILKSILYDRNYKIMYATITKEMINKTHASYDDASQIIDVLRNFKDVDVAILFIKNNRNVYVKIRSKNIDVANIMKDFGGGGHKYAAGGMCYSDSEFWLMNNIMTRVKQEIEKYRNGKEQ